MADPVTLGLTLSAASAGAQGIAGYQAAQGEKERAEINSFVGRTRAMQTDTTARQGLESELGTFRAAMGANGQQAGVGTMEMVNELRTTRNRERRIQVGARMQESYDASLQAKNAGAAGRGALLSGALKAGPSLFDLYDYNRAR